MYLLRVKPVCICILVGKVVGLPSAAFNVEGGVRGATSIASPLQMPSKAWYGHIENIGAQRVRSGSSRAVVLCSCDGGGLHSPLRRWAIKRYLNVLK